MTTLRMSKILIIGATGMMGHKLALKLANKHQVWATVRKSVPDFFKQQAVKIPQFIEGVDAFKLETVKSAIDKVKPDYVLNCVGIVKQLAEAKDPVTSITINSLFPNQLEKLTDEKNFRLIHFSTDCVFSGKKGPYKQTDLSDVNDLYGMTKFLGEAQGPNALTLRSSIVGREFTNPTGLLEWFLSQKGGTVKGFKNALYTGLTTNTMADLIAYIIDKCPTLQGLYHVASPEISKFDLLQIVNDVAGTGTKIEPETAFFCDRRLNGDEFHNETGWKSPSWPEMVKTMFDEDSRYYITSR